MDKQKSAINMQKFDSFQATLIRNVSRSTIQAGWLKFDATAMSSV